MANWGGAVDFQIQKSEHLGTGTQGHYNGSGGKPDEIKASTPAQISEGPKEVKITWAGEKDGRRERRKMSRKPESLGASESLLRPRVLHCLSFWS